MMTLLTCIYPYHHIIIHIFMCVHEWEAKIGPIGSIFVCLITQILDAIICIYQLRLMIIINILLVSWSPEKFCMRFLVCIKVVEKCFVKIGHVFELLCWTS